MLVILGHYLVYCIHLNTFHSFSRHTADNYEWITSFHSWILHSSGKAFHYILDSAYSVYEFRWWWGGLGSSSSSQRSKMGLRSGVSAGHKCFYINLGKSCLHEPHFVHVLEPTFYITVCFKLWGNDLRLYLLIRIRMTHDSQMYFVITFSSRLMILHLQTNSIFMDSPALVCGFLKGPWHGSFHKFSKGHSVKPIRCLL